MICSRDTVAEAVLVDTRNIVLPPNIIYILKDSIKIFRSLAPKLRLSKHLLQTFPIQGILLSRQPGRSESQVQTMLAVLNRNTIH